ncbi:hypothetical protein ABZX51_012169 [Aspergillus tubingensis]
MNAEIDAQVAIEALHRRRVQNRLAQRNRRKRQAELEQLRMQNLANKQQERPEERRNEETMAADNKSGQSCPPTVGDGVTGEQTNTTAGSDMSVDSTIGMHNSPVEPLAVIAPDKLSWHQDGYVGGGLDLSPSTLTGYDKMNDSITTFLLDPELDLPRDSSTPKLTSINPTSASTPQARSNPLLHQESAIRTTRSKFEVHQRVCKAQATNCGVIRHQCKEGLPTVRMNVPTNLSAMMEIWDNGSLLHKYSSESQGKTALHISAERGDVGIVQFLLIQGVDVNCADGWGRTALHYAVRAAHVDIVTQLLAAGAEIGARDHHGQSPLHVAVDVGSEVIVRLLADEGADLNAPIDIPNHIREGA